MPINSSTSPSIFWWQPATWLRVSGADAANFLQGQFTNDLRALGTVPAVYGLWLNVKGKVLADSFVLRGPAGDDFWVGSYYSGSAVIRERLESFVIADDVTVEDVTPEWAGVSLIGAVAGEAGPGGPAEGAWFRGRRTSPPNVEWIFPSKAAAAVRSRLAGVPELTADDLTRRRIDDGIPMVPVDMGPGDLPNEGGLDADAISYTKGCYLGQEVMARLKSMGRVRRRLLRVTGSGEVFPSLPARLFARGRQVGELRSLVRENAGGVRGFAMLSLPNVTADSVLAFAADGPPALRLIDPP